MINYANAGATLNGYDMYGIPAEPVGMQGIPLTLNGPGPSYAANPLSPTPASTAPALSLVGIGLLLLAWRVLVEIYGDEE